MTEETAAKIMQQYKDDAAVVGDMLANERRRQAEVMRARLAEQRFRRKKNLSKTHEDEVKEAEVLLKQEQELKVLHDVQESEYTEVVRVLTDQEQVLVGRLDTEDAEEEQALAGLTTIAQCEAFGAQLKAQIEAVRICCTCCTCWWYSLCHFQYRQHYEQTCSGHVDC